MWTRLGSNFKTKHKLKAEFAKSQGHALGDMHPNYASAADKLFNHVLMATVKHKGMRMDEFTQLLQGQALFRMALTTIPACSSEEHQAGLFKCLDLLWPPEERNIEHAPSQDSDKQEEGGGLT